MKKLSVSYSIGNKKMNEILRAVDLGVEGAYQKEEFTAKLDETYPYGQEEVEKIKEAVMKAYDDGIYEIKNIVVKFIDIYED